MSDLTDFLLARIAEDEAVAREAIPGTYSPNADEDGSWRMIEVDHEGIWPEPASKPVPSWGYESGETWAEHVARHDPSRVLAECASKRRIVEMNDADYPALNDAYGCDDSCALPWVLRVLALPFAGHSDYRVEWRP